MLRGNERKNIFLDDEDKLYWLEILSRIKERGRFYLQAFCLMDNHLHLILSEGSEDVATVMKRINVSYVSYFNKKYRRVGHLFQDRFKSEAIEENDYLLALTRYIHQNPVKAGLVKHMGDYKWSSYNGYIDDKNRFAKILDTDVVLDLFSMNKATARKLFIEYMNKESEESFMDLPEDVIDEKEAEEIYLTMLKERGLDEHADNAKIPDEFIREFKEKTGLSIRKIAVIVNMNKDKVNKILKAKL